MKILLLTDIFPPQTQTSVGTIVENYARNFKALGHEILIVTPTNDKNKIGVSEHNGLKVHLIFNNKAEKLMYYFNLYNPSVVNSFKKILREFRPDVVHAHVIHLTFSYACLKVAKKSGAKVFLTTHDADLFHQGKLLEFIDKDPQLKTGLSICTENNIYKVGVWQQIKRFKKRFIPFRQKIIKHYLKSVDKIFSVSQALAEAHRQNGINNIVVVHNGVDVNNWQISEKEIKDFQQRYNLLNKKVVFWGGRLSTLKGGGLLINALEKVVKKIPNTILLIIGKKDAETEKFFYLAKQKNIFAIVTGWLNHQEIAAAYNASDLVVVPSAYLDPFPTINLEAMACHKPIVGTCFGGTSEIVQNNQTGFIVNPYNKEFFAEKILTLLNNPDLIKIMGEAGFQRIKNEFSLNKQIKETIKYYEQNYA